MDYVQVAWRIKRGRHGFYIENFRGWKIDIERDVGLNENRFVQPKGDTQPKCTLTNTWQPREKIRVDCRPLYFMEHSLYLSWKPRKDRKRMGSQKDRKRIEKGWSSLPFFYPFPILFLSFFYSFPILLRSHPFSSILSQFSALLQTLTHTYSDGPKVLKIFEIRVKTQYLIKTLYTYMYMHISTPYSSFGLNNDGKINK